MYTQTNANNEEAEETVQWPSEDNKIRVALTHKNIKVPEMYERVKTPRAGAVVMFSGCTRDTSIPEGSYLVGGEEQNLNSHAYTVTNGTNPENAVKSSTSSSLPVASLTYSSYIPLAMKTLRAIATRIHDAHGLERIAITHRLGTVPLGEESIVICVSAGHRQEAWRAGEEALEEVKRRVEIWKWEVFRGAGDDGGDGVWRSNAVDNKLKEQVGAGGM